MLTAKVLRIASSTTLVLTAVLFLIAAFEKGLTHELLLEAGVFLVSVKLVLATERSDLAFRKIESKIDAVETKLDQKSHSDRSPPSR